MTGSCQLAYPRGLGFGPAEISPYYVLGGSAAHLLAVIDRRHGDRRRHGQLRRPLRPAGSPAETGRHVADRADHGEQVVRVCGDKNYWSSTGHTGLRDVNDAGSLWFAARSVRRRGGGAGPGGPAGLCGHEYRADDHPYLGFGSGIGATSLTN